MATSDSILEQELASFFEARTRTLALVEGLGQDVFDRRPDPRRWSIGEVLDHLRLADGFLPRDLGWLLERSRLGRPTYLIHSFRDLDIGFRGIPLSVMPPFERPLTTPELQGFAEGFRVVAWRAFSLPFVNLAQVAQQRAAG